MQPNAEEEKFAEESEGEPEGLVEEEAETSSYETDSTSEEDAEEEPNAEAVPEPDGNDGDDSSLPEDSKELRDRLNRAHSQIERLKSEVARYKSPKGSSKGGEAKSEGAIAAAEQALMAAYGFKAREDQEIIKEFARKAGMDITSALTDDFIMSRYEHAKKKVQIQRASARPSNKAKTAKRNPAYYIERGIIPKDKDEARAVRQELARRSSDGYISP